MKKPDQQVNVNLDWNPITPGLLTESQQTISYLAKSHHHMLRAVLRASRCAYRDHSERPGALFLFFFCYLILCIVYRAQASSMQRKAMT